MSNRRFVPRQRRRLKVALGTQPTFTADVSPGGFAAELVVVPRPGTHLHGKVWLGERSFPFTGEVTWARAGDPRLSVRGRMGLRFTGIENAFFELLAKDPAFCSSPAALAQV